MVFSAAPGMRSGTRRVLLPVLVALAACAPPALAQPAIVVDGVLMPAWVERGGARAPLTIGMELRRGDVIRTGSGSRVLLRLVEGSAVKLGQNALLQLDEVAPSIGGLFRASLRVADGAFRFTTSRLVRSQRREVSVAFATVTAAVRGTDFWGKSTRDRQTVCLIEGRLGVGAAGEAPVTMDRARQFYRREKGVTQPIGLVSASQLVEWAKETEIERGSGAAGRGGAWTVTVASVDSERAADALSERMSGDGFAVESQLVKFGARSTYQVLVTNLASKEDAEALAAKLKSRYGVTDPEISGP
jgi:hypothetical protein